MIPPTHVGRHITDTCIFKTNQFSQEKNRRHGISTFMLPSPANQSSVAAVSSPHSVLCMYNRRVRLIFVLRFDTPANSSYRQTTQVWVQPHERQVRVYKIHFQVTIPLVSLLSRNLRKALTIFRWSCQLILESSLAAQNTLISRVSIWERYLLSHSGISPLATSNYTNISVQRIKSWKTYTWPTLNQQFPDSWATDGRHTL